jgi:hypothetical protein
MMLKWMYWWEVGDWWRCEQGQEGRGSETRQVTVLDQHVMGDSTVWVSASPTVVRLRSVAWSPGLHQHASNTLDPENGDRTENL